MEVSGWMEETSPAGREGVEAGVVCVRLKMVRACAVGMCMYMGVV